MSLPFIGPAALRALFRTYGVVGLARRIRHEARARLGWYRRQPSRSGRPAPAQARTEPAFRVNHDLLAGAVDRAAALARGDRVAAGEYEAFRWRWVPLPWGPEWHRHPSTGRTMGAARPWWTVPLMDPEFGDIKELWEPGRFGWVYDLIRAQAVSGDPRYAVAFLDRLDDFVQANPAFSGPHWACGQETSIRAIALLYAEANLAGCAGLARLLDLLAASGERIEDGIGYALSQRNNHAISEAVGLLAIGHRLGGIHPAASRWRRRGLRLLPRLIAEQFAPDGWYSQHSFTYLRLAADQCVVALRVLAADGGSLPPEARTRLAAAVELLDVLIDPASGIVPNHGPNDGAYVHPISSGEYRDFRPVMTALSALLGRPLSDDLEPDRETLGWLGARLPAARAARRQGVASGASGWVVLRHRDYFAFMRAGAYRNRPGHFDPLHVDIRIGGREVIVDPGTFRYGGPPPWRNALAGAGVHNGPVADGFGEAAKGPRFLWLEWPDARITAAEEDAGGCHALAEIPGRVRREVRVHPGGVDVVDWPLSPEGAMVRVTWLLHPDADPRSVTVEGGRLHAAREDEPKGWFSPRYGDRRPAGYYMVQQSMKAGDTLRAEVRGMSG